MPPTTLKTHLPNQSKLEAALGYVFADKGLLTQALTHSSHANEAGIPENSNERLEFFGDAVLQLFVSEMLYKKETHMTEGQLTRRRIDLVCEGSLAQLARRIGLGEHLLIGTGEQLDFGYEKESILSDAFEAVIGAVYLDGGAENASKVIQSLFEQHEFQLHFENYKGELNELLLQDSDKTAQYEIIGETGREHRKQFEAAVFHMGRQLGVGCGQTKKAAEQQAAKVALVKLRG